MANRQNIFLLKRSNIPGKVPAPGDIKLGEVALNTSDVILYASGTTSNSILPIGWDRISRTGDTVTGDYNIFGNIAISGSSLPGGFALSVTGDSNFVGDSYISNDLFVSGNTIIQNGLTAGTIYTDYIDFNTGATATGKVGRLIWNNADEIGGLEVTMRGGNVTLQVGEENLARVFNADTVPLTDGMVVYVYGSQGNTISVKRASSTGETTSARVLGIVTETIAVGGRGFVNTFGLVRGLNTSTYSGGTPLWLGTTPGTYTSTKPIGPQHTVLIGFVSRVSATVGSIFIHISNGWELDELHDARISGATTGDLLMRSTYNGKQVWINTKTLTGSYTITGNTTINNNLYVGNTITATTIGSPTNCISDLYVSIIHGCSPISIYNPIRYSGATVSGIGSFSFGIQTSATTDASHAEGRITKALGIASHAEGSGTTASGLYSHAEGRRTRALGNQSHSEGWLTIASGTTSHAEGEQTTASGIGSHAEGSNTTTPGNFSHSEGGNTTASGNQSHAEGYFTTASGNQSHAEGESTIANRQASHAEGSYTTASGLRSHAEGYLTIASGTSSHAEGQQTTANGQLSHAEGGGTTASGAGSHAEGANTRALGNYSHSEGYVTTSSGVFSHAEGNYTTALGSYSHAEGNLTIASGSYSHAEGLGTVANGNYQHVQGLWNLTGSTTQGAFIIGNGTGNLNRSNLFFAASNQVNISGNLNITGDTFMSGDFCMNNMNSTGQTGTNCLDTTLIPTGTTVIHQFQGESGILAHIGDLATGEPNSRGYTYFENNLTNTSFTASGTGVFTPVIGAPTTFAPYNNLFVVTTGATAATINKMKYNYPPASGTSSATYLKFTVSLTVQNAQNQQLTFQVRRNRNGVYSFLPIGMSVTPQSNNIQGVTFNGISDAWNNDYFQVVVKNDTGSGGSNSIRIVDMSFSMFT